MLRFKVDSMNCGHCVRAVTQAVEAVDPAAAVSIDLASKDVAVETTRAADIIADAIRGAGYSPVAVR